MYYFRFSTAVWTLAAKEIQTGNNEAVQGMFTGFVPDSLLQLFLRVSEGAAGSTRTASLLLHVPTHVRLVFTVLWGLKTDREGKRYGERGAKSPLFNSVRHLNTDNCVSSEWIIVRIKSLSPQGWGLSPLICQLMADYLFSTISLLIRYDAIPQKREEFFFFLIFGIEGNPCPGLGK